MNRREHLKQSAALAGSLCAWPAWLTAAPGDAAEETPAPDTSAEGQVMTVTGPIAPEQMGTALPHEHVASRFGAAPERRPSYDVAALFEAVGPALRRIHELGCNTVACATAAYFGRDPLILKQLSERTGVQLLTNTGYYGATDDRYCRPTLTRKALTNWLRAGSPSGAPGWTEPASVPASSRRRWTGQARTASEHSRILIASWCAPPRGRISKAASPSPCTPAGTSPGRENSSIF